MNKCCWPGCDVAECELLWFRRPVCAVHRSMCVGAVIDGTPNDELLALLDASTEVCPTPGTPVICATTDET